MSVVSVPTDVAVSEAASESLLPGLGDVSDVGDVGVCDGDLRLLWLRFVSFSPV